MRFLFLIHGDTEGEAALTAEERRAIVSEHMAYASMLRERGVYVLGEALTGEPAVCARARRHSSRMARSPRRRKASAASTSSSARAATRRSSSRARCPSPGVAVEVHAIADL